MNRLRRARRVLLTFAAAGAILAGSALPAAAAQDAWSPPPGWSTAPGGANSNGVGFCVSQLAQFPELSVGISSAGEAIRELATSGPGVVPDTLEGAGYPACGGPGSWGLERCGCPLPGCGHRTALPWELEDQAEAEHPGWEAERMRVPAAGPRNAQPLRLGHSQRAAPRTLARFRLR